MEWPDGGAKLTSFAERALCRRAAAADGSHAGRGDGLGRRYRKARTLSPGRLRKQMSELVIESVQGLRQLLLHGIDGVRGEWSLVTSNVKRMSSLCSAIGVARGLLRKNESESDPYRASCGQIRANCPSIPDFATGNDTPNRPEIRVRRHLASDINVPSCGSLNRQQRSRSQGSILSPRLWIDTIVATA
jgi:hypothetical protein